MKLIDIPAMLRTMSLNDQYTPPQTTEQQGRLGFRHIPAVTFSVFGGFLVVGSVLSISLDIALSLAGQSPLSGFRLFGGLLFVAAGAVWVIAGRSWLHRKWWPATLCSLIGYFVGVGGALIAFPHAL
jgi:hypothetical protein